MSFSALMAGHYLSDSTLSGFHPVRDGIAHSLKGQTITGNGSLKLEPRGEAAKTDKSFTFKPADRKPDTKPAAKTGPKPASVVTPTSQPRLSTKPGAHLTAAQRRILNPILQRVERHAAPHLNFKTAARSNILNRAATHNRAMLMKQNPRLALEMQKLSPQPQPTAQKKPEQKNERFISVQSLGKQVMKAAFKMATDSLMPGLMPKLPMPRASRKFDFPELIAA